MQAYGDIESSDDDCLSCGQTQQVEAQFDNSIKTPHACEKLQSSEQVYGKTLTTEMVKDKLVSLNNEMSVPIKNINNYNNCGGCCRKVLIVIIEILTTILILLLLVLIPNEFRKMMNAKTMSMSIMT